MILCYLLTGFAASGVAFGYQDNWDRSYKPPPPLQYKVEAQTLHNSGFADDERFPNKCYGGVTLSDKFVAHYKSRGFSLPAICLAARASWIRYDIETGKPLRVVNGFVVDIPDCFKNGTPLLDCEYNFEHFEGLKSTDAYRQEIRDRAIQVDQAIRTLIADGKFSRECTCGDLEIFQPRNYNGKPYGEPYLQIKGSGNGGQQPAQQYACRLEHFPRCAGKVPPGQDLTGFMVYEVREGVHFNWTPLKGSTDYGPFDISPSLPHGYAYKIGSPEGDDDSPFLDVEPGTKFDVDE